MRRQAILSERMFSGFFRVTVCGPYRFGEVRVAEVALLIFTVLSSWRSCGVVITKFSDHVVTFRSSPTVFADTPVPASASTRILADKPPRAMWSAATPLGLYRMRAFAHFRLTAYNLFTPPATGRQHFSWSGRFAPRCTQQKSDRFPRSGGKMGKSVLRQCTI